MTVEGKAATMAALQYGVRLIDVASDYVHAIHGVLPGGSEDDKFERLTCVTCECDDKFMNLTNVDWEPTPTTTKIILDVRTSASRLITRGR